MSNFVGGIISLTLAVIVLSNVFMTVVKDQNTSGWSTGEVSLYSVLGLIGIMGLVYGAANIFGLI